MWSVGCRAGGNSTCQSEAQLPTGQMAGLSLSYFRRLNVNVTFNQHGRLVVGSGGDNRSESRLGGKLGSAEKEDAGIGFVKQQRTWMSCENISISHFH